MAQKTVYVVFYEQYGRTTTTAGFEESYEMRRPLSAVRRHIKMYLEDPAKDYIKNVKLVEFTFVDGVPTKMEVLPNE